MKRICTLFLVIIMCGNVIEFAFAQNSAIVSQATIYFNGELLETSALELNNRILVPIRKIAEKMGSSVIWDERNQSVIVRRGLQTAVFKIEDKNVYSREHKKIDSNAILHQGITYIPLRAISEIFNAQVEWNGDLNTVSINCEIPSEANIIEEITNYGFYRFNYFGETFQSLHADGSALSSSAWGTVIGNLGDWSTRTMKGVVNMFQGKGFDTEYEKDLYKKVIPQILSQVNYKPEVDKFSEILKIYLKGTKTVTKFSVEEAWRKAAEQTSASEAEMKVRKKEWDEFSKSMGNISKFAKFLELGIEDITFIMTDYSQHAKLLAVIEEAISKNRADNNPALTAAIDELRAEYAHNYIKVLNDLWEEGSEWILGKMFSKSVELVEVATGTTIMSLYSITEFALESAATITGWKDYGDNTNDAVAVYMIASALNFAYENQRDHVFDVRNRTINQRLSDKEWDKFVDLFTVTQAAFVELYECMNKVTTNEIERLYLKDQMDILNDIGVFKKKPQGYYDVFYVGKTPYSTEEELELLNAIVGKEWVINPLDNPSVVYTFDKNGNYSKNTLSNPIKKESGKFEVKGNTILLNNSAEKFVVSSVEDYTCLSQSVQGKEKSNYFSFSVNAYTHCVHCGAYLLYENYLNWICENGHSFWCYPDSPLYSETDNGWYELDGSVQYYEEIEERQALEDAVVINPSISEEKNKLDFTGDNVAEIIEKDYQETDWRGNVYIKDGVTHEILYEYAYMTKSSEWRIVWSEAYQVPYFLAVSSFSDAKDITSIYEFKNGSFERVDTWGIYVNKDSLPYTSLYRCGIEEDNYRWSKNQGSCRSEAEYEAYKARYSFEELVTSQRSN